MLAEVGEDDQPGDRLGGGGHPHHVDVLLLDVHVVQGAVQQSASGAVGRD